MTKREAKKILPTMKAELTESNEEKLELAFVECQAEIISVVDTDTKHGEKVVCGLKNDDLGEFSVFLNNFSMQNLIEAFGDDDKKWLGKLVDLTKEEDKKYKKDMIVLNPVK